MMPSNIIPKRKLGSTGLTVTVLGMGGAPLGGLFQVRRADMANDMGAYVNSISFWIVCGLYGTRIRLLGLRARW